MPTLPKVKFWSSSPLVAGKRAHSVLMTVSTAKKGEQTAVVATCINAAVSTRIAELLNKEPTK